MKQGYPLQQSRLLWQNDHPTWYIPARHDSLLDARRSIRSVTRFGLLRTVLMASSVAYVALLVLLYSHAGHNGVPALTGGGVASAFWLLSWPSIYTLSFWSFMTHVVLSLAGVSPDFDAWWFPPAILGIQQLAFVTLIFWKRDVVFRRVTRRRA